MKKVIFFLSLIAFFSCSKKEESTFEEMKSDKLMSESFTNSELKDLAKIVDFFEEQICSKSKNEIEICYNSFLKKDSTIMFDENMMNTFDYKKQEELYSKLDSSFFNEFWEEGSGTQFPGGEYEVKYKYFHLRVFDENGESKYVKFVNRFSKENKFIKEYIDGVNITGDFYSPATPVLLTVFYKRHNKQDIKIRMIYAFHYLNINEELMKPELYRKKKL